MGKKSICITVLMAILLTACNDRYKYWEISKFKMVPNALEDLEPIKLIYTSRSPDNNPDYTYYIHIIAVSQKTGDTVNILTPEDNGFNMTHKYKIFNYVNPHNVISDLIHFDTESAKNIDWENIDSLPSKWDYNKITKVARDPKFDYVADNNYPTVIGMVVSVEGPK